MVTVQQPHVWTSPWFTSVQLHLAHFSGLPYLQKLGEQSPLALFKSFCTESTLLCLGVLFVLDSSKLCLTPPWVRVVAGFQVNLHLKCDGYRSCWALYLCSTLHLGVTGFQQIYELLYLYHNIFLLFQYSHTRIAWHIFLDFTQFYVLHCILHFIGYFVFPFVCVCKIYIFYKI